MGKQTQHAPQGAAKTATMTQGQRDYEARRAAKAGLTLDRWLEQKRRAEAADAAAQARAAKPATPRKPGFIARLIERAHKPLS